MKEFEPKYVRSIEAFYTKRVSTLPKDVSYFNTVSEWIAAEELKTRSYLPQMSESEVSGAVDGVLITANEPFFVEKFDHCLSSGDTDHARLIHTLLTRVGRSGSLSPALFEHVKAVVGKTVSLADPGVPSSVVAAFASAHAQCFSLIAGVFCGDSKAKSELSIALRKAFAGHDIQAPRALALYCNEIASRPKKDSSDLAKEVDSIAIVAEFLEDKDVFFDLHETLLAKRLIRFHAESEALDRAVLDRLKEVCGSSFTRRMEHMLADVASSKSVVENFLASTDLSCKLSSHLL